MELISEGGADCEDELVNMTVVETTLKEGRIE